MLSWNFCCWVFICILFCWQLCDSTDRDFPRFLRHCGKSSSVPVRNPPHQPPPPQCCNCWFPFVPEVNDISMIREQLSGLSVCLPKNERKELNCIIHIQLVSYSQFCPKRSWFFWISVLQVPLKTKNKKTNKCLSFIIPLMICVHRWRFRRPQKASARREGSATPVVFAGSCTWPNKG